jgi:hypothetical protein
MNKDCKCMELNRVGTIFKSTFLYFIKTDELFIFDSYLNKFENK